MADWDEEIRRQRAISALLEAPEAQAQSDQNPPSLDTQTDEQVVAPDTTIPKHVEEHYGDWKKWDTISDQQVTSQSDYPADKTPAVTYPTIAQDQGQPDKKYDTQVAEQIIPYGEREKPSAPEPAYTTLDTGKGAAPEDYPTIAQDQGAREGSGEQAPDALTQVERGELWRLPWHPSASRVERAQPVTYPTVAQDQGAPPPKQAYPDQIVTPEEKAGTKSVVNQSPASTLATVDQPKVAPPPVQQPAREATGDWRTWTTTDGTPADPTFKPSAKGEVTRTESVTSNPDGTELPQRVQAVGDQDPAAFIVHHTSGRGTVDGVVQTLKERGLGVEYVMDRDGNIYQTGGPGAQNIKAGWGAGAGLNNSNVVGMEIIALDDKDVTDAQKQSFARFIAARYPNTPLFGHGEVNPGHKEADEGLSAKAAALAYREKGGDAGDTLAQLQSSGLNVTTYGQKDDPYSDKDSRAGKGAYVDQLVPGYDVALNAAAARLVGNPQPGQEFTYAGRTFRYGDKVPENYSDARFDVFDPYNTALSALGKGTAAAAPKKQDWESWATLSPEAVTSAVTAANKTDIQKLQDNLQGSGNLIQFYKDLNTNPPKGISPEAVNSFKASLQKVITQQMQERFPDMTTDVAWKKALADSSLWDIGSEFWHQGQASFAQLAPVFAQKSPDREQVNAFFDNVMPGASDADKQAFLTKVHGMPREQQGPFIASQLPAPQAGQRGNDPMAVLTAIDHLSDPDFQAAETKKLADARALADRANTMDPRLKGSVGGDLASLGAVPEQLMAYYGIPIIGAAQASEEVRQRLAKEHPDWDEATLDDKSAFSALAQVAGNTVAANLMAHGAGVLLKTVTAPWKRAVGQVLGGALTNMGITVGTTAATNVAEGRAPETGLGEAARSGAIQGGLVGGVHGAGELMPEAKVSEVQAPRAEVQPTEPVPLGRESVTPPPETGEKGAPVALVPEARTAAEQPASSEPLLPEAQPQASIPSSAGTPEPWLSKIANRFTAERIAKGDIGPVEPGHGETTEALVARGSTMGPETVAQHVSNLLHDVGGDPVDQAAAVRFEEARLSQRSHELSRIAEENPLNQQARIDADEALKYVTDFHNGPVAKLKNNWHKMGKTLQGDVPVDLSNFNGLREEYFKNTGKMPPSETEPVLRNAARKMRAADAAQEVAMRKLGAEIDREAARRPLPTHEQVKEAIAKRMGGKFPCPV
jgi:N-acetylmuramoyl-L-alanine amidase